MGRFVWLLRVGSKMSSHPDISIFMITDDSYAKCARTISYLKQQTIVDRIEMVIVGPSLEEMQPDFDDLQDFHSYKIVEMGEFPWVGVAAARGFKEASAEYVIYAEEHDFPPDDWAEVVLKAFESGGYDAVGWGMLPANPGLVAWAHIYGQFGDAVAPLESGPAERLGPHHGAYRRETLLEYGEDLPYAFGNEGVLYPDLIRRGKTLYLTGETVTEHTQISNFSDYARLEFIGMRIYAASRMRVEKWPIWKRALYIAGSPLIPFLRLWRSLGHIRRTKRSRELLPQAAFVILAVNVAGALGEAIGYAIGADDQGRAERMQIELDRYSFVNEQDRAGRARFASGKTVQETDATPPQQGS
ncbi:glycosyltransferase [Shimia aestuarii]|uniref:glycosyltransferase n=1 Tax=Shimia aestuarii TaxID=254406 RepID=UPI001FB51AC5|nr:glycosyltransferase [Shimia aestuarii]